MADLAEAPADAGLLLNEGPRLLGRADRVLQKVLLQRVLVLGQGAVGVMPPAAAQVRQAALIILVEVALDGAPGDVGVGGDLVVSQAVALEPEDLHLALDAGVGVVVTVVGQGVPVVRREGDDPHDGSTLMLSPGCSPSAVYTHTLPPTIRARPGRAEYNLDEFMPDLSAEERGPQLQPIQLGEKPMTIVAFLTQFAPVDLHPWVQIDKQNLNVRCNRQGVSPCLLCDLEYPRKVYFVNPVFAVADGAIKALVISDAHQPFSLGPQFKAELTQGNLDKRFLIIRGCPRSTPSGAGPRSPVRRWGTERSRSSSRHSRETGSGSKTRSPPTPTSTCLTSIRSGGMRRPTDSSAPVISPR